MAGIGFRLEKLLSEDSYSGTARAYTHAAIVSAGNWLAACASLSLLVYFSKMEMDFRIIEKFQVTVTYIYCFSMLLVGFLQMVLHRYLADVFFERRPDKVSGCMRGALILHCLAAVPMGGLFFWVSGLEPVDVALATILFVTMVCIWITSTFLTVCKSYEYLTASAFVSYGATFGMAYLLGKSLGYSGLLAGFTLGHVLLFCLLYGQVVKEFSDGPLVRFRWLHWAVKHRWLVAAGFFSNLAVWTDKMVFWWGGDGVPVLGLMYGHPIYDPCMFLALMTAVPAYAHYLLVLETHFYRLFKSYYAEVCQGAEYDLFHRTKHRMVRTLRYEYGQLLKLQGAIVLAVLYLAPHILDAAGIRAAYMHVLRVSTLGVAVGVGVLLHLVLLLYLDHQKEAAAVGLFYAFTSALWSYVSLGLGFRWFGYGYLTGSLLSLALAVVILNRCLEQLEYTTFRRYALKYMSGIAEEPVP